MTTGRNGLYRFRNANSVDDTAKARNKVTFIKNKRQLLLPRIDTTSDNRESKNESICERDMKKSNKLT